MAASPPPGVDLSPVQGEILKAEARPSTPTTYEPKLTILRAGLPSKTQTYYFFVIDQSRIKQFRQQLAHVIPLITTTAQVFDHRKTIHHEKSDAQKRGVPPPLLKISGFNIVFSHKGLKKVSQAVWMLFAEALLIRTITLEDWNRR